MQICTVLCVIFHKNPHSRENSNYNANSKKKKVHVLFYTISIHVHLHLNTTVKISPILLKDCTPRMAETTNSFKVSGQGLYRGHFAAPPISNHRRLSKGELFTVSFFLFLPPQLISSQSELECIKGKEEEKT